WPAAPRSHRVRPPRPDRTRVGRVRRRSAPGHRSPSHRSRARGCPRCWVRRDRSFACTQYLESGLEQCGGPGIGTGVLDDLGHDLLGLLFLPAESDEGVDDLLVAAAEGQAGPGAEAAGWGSLFSSSRMIREAPFLPIPGTRVSAFASWFEIAEASSSGPITDRIAIANRGPMPEIVRSSSKVWFSSSEPKPY